MLVCFHHLVLLDLHLGLYRFHSLNDSPRKISTVREKQFQQAQVYVWSLIRTAVPEFMLFLMQFQSLCPFVSHERTTTAKNMGILKCHPTSLISYERGWQFHAWKILSNQTRPPIRVPGENQVFIC
jgi:hypothetical protein